MHHVLKEHFVNLFTSRPQVFRIQARSKVINHHGSNPLSQHRRNLARSFLVPRKNNGQLHISKPWLRISASNHFRHLNQSVHVAAIGPTRHQNNVRAQLPQPLNFLEILSAIIDRKGIHQNRPCTKCRPLSRLSTHRFHHASDHHLQATTRRRSGNIIIRSVQRTRRSSRRLIILRKPMHSTVLQQRPSTLLITFRNRLLGDFFKLG